MLEKTIKKVLVTEDEICAKSREIGQVLTQEYKDKNPLMVAILKGSVPFFAELTKRIDTHIEMDFMVVSSYHGGTSSSGVTATSMMFMMPMPPTSSEIDATLASSRVITRPAEPATSAACVMEWTAKS